MFSASSSSPGELDQVAAAPVLPTELFAGIGRTAGVPLYAQVASRIERAIADGTIAPGARIDNEVALVERLGLSRPTIRRAIQELVDRGLLVRRRGIGTQVVQGHPVSRAVELTSLYDDLEASGRRPRTEVLRRVVQDADAAVAERLGVPVGAPVLHLRRLRLAEGVPLAVLDNHLPEEFADLDGHELAARGLYGLLRARGVTIRVARQRIGARSAGQEERELLELDRHGAVLTMERIAYDNAGHAVEFGHHVYRPDLYSFETTLVAK